MSSLRVMNLERYEFIDHVRRNLRDAPPLSDETRARVIALFRLGLQMAESDQYGLAG